MKKVLLLIVWINAAMLQAQFYGSKDGIRNSTVGQWLHSDCCLLGKYKITGSTGFFYNKITYKTDGGKYTDFDRYGWNFNLSYKIYKDFQVRLFFYADLHQGAGKPKWLSNLFYNIGYYNWRNKTFSYGYENYQPNRFDGSYNWWDNFKRGFFFVSYNLHLISDRSPLKWDESSQFGLVPFVRYQPEYTDRTGTRVMGHNKVAAGLSSRWTLWHHIYVEGAVFAYLNKNSQLPWDPDYTYGFGYFDWHNFTLVFSYGNWIANRFPGRALQMKNDFGNGEFKVAFNYIW